jgi:hypothetical protein
MRFHLLQRNKHRIQQLVSKFGRVMIAHELADQPLLLRNAQMRLGNVAFRSRKMNFLSLQSL